MKVALITDLHFGVRNDDKRFLAFQEKFYRDMFFPYLIQNNIKHVIVLGDVFDRRKYSNHNTIFEVRKFFADKLEENNIETHVIVGNHDAAYKNTNKVNTCDLLFQDYDNIKVYSEADEITIDNCNIILIPWINSSNYDITMDKIKNTKAQILLGHLEVKGFKMYKSSVNEDHGFDLDTFRKFDIVCSGHYHHKSTQNNVHYLGAPYEMTWSDYNDARGFHILDTKTREMDYVINPYKMFHKLIYDDENQTEQELFSIPFSELENTFVKVIVKNKSNPYLFDKFMTEIEKAQTLDIQIVDDHLNLNLSEDEEIINEAEDTLTILNNYIQQMETGVDTILLSKFIGELYHEALNVE